MQGNTVAYLVVVLCYKPEDRGSIPDEITGFYNWPNPSSSTMTLGSTQPLTEMNTKGKGRPARKADDLTTIC
jgi:hypothetical protein